jgi:hypothetical protein
MSKQPSLPFEGSLLDATGYHMSIIDTSAIYRAILNNKRALEEEYRVAWDETEELYAWCVVLRQLHSLLVSFHGRIR